MARKAIEVKEAEGKIKNDIELHVPMTYTRR
jgi:hypothetical protein